MRRLPPLNALRAFEAAARHCSFSRAAEELHVTAGAVSQQVKALEARLGLRLFRRHARGLTLTADGQALWPKLAAALDRMAAATAEAAARGADKPALVISALPALAEKWLVPRLGRFRAAHPEVEVRLLADDRVADLAREGIDVGLRYGAGEQLGLTAELLFAEQIFPVCSPALLAGARPLRAPEDLAHHTLLHDTHWRAEWEHWLTAAGAAAVDPARGPSFTLYSMALQAAADGLGVAMGHGVLVAGELSDGRLVAPFRLRLAAPGRHYLVYRPDTLDRPPVRAFRDWVLREARTTSR